jgi:hypothetical protein
MSPMLEPAELRAQRMPVKAPNPSILEHWVKQVLGHAWSPGPLRKIRPKCFHACALDLLGSLRVLSRSVVVISAAHWGR